MFLVAEAYGYLVHYRPYQGAKKGKQVATPTKWGLGENVVLRLVECLTPAVSFDIFMDNFFTSFRLLTNLGVNNNRATGVLHKNRLRQCTIIGEKKEHDYFEQRIVHQGKKQCNSCGWLERH